MLKHGVSDIVKIQRFVKEYPGEFQCTLYCLVCEDTAHGEESIYVERHRGSKHTCLLL